MELILVRHGNTFQSGDKAYWVGAGEDLPLVSTGREQAILLSTAFKKVRFLPQAIYSGPLKRTAEFAEIIINQLQLNTKTIIDHRLNEINYGQWAGLTSQAVCDQFGKTTLENWEQYSKWPTQTTGGWGESEESVIQRIHAFSNDLIHRHAHHEIALAVTSNGCLRYFLKLISGEFEKHIAMKNIKVATGHFCHLTHDGKTWHLKSWNQTPVQML